MSATWRVLARPWRGPDRPSASSGDQHDGIVDDDAGKADNAERAEERERLSGGQETEGDADQDQRYAHEGQKRATESSSGGLRTPALVRVAPPSWGRYPQTFTEAVLRRGQLSTLKGPSPLSRATAGWRSES
jgi:hypothetical protein